MKKDIKILAIETSCDETAAAGIGEDPPAGGGQPVILSNIISSSVAFHAETGGIVPEVASRAPMEMIVPVVSQALLDSVARHSRGGGNPENKDWIPDQVGDDNYLKSNYAEAIKILQNDITHIAVTAGPGLIGSLLVGFNAAKTLAYARDLPIIPINHIEGHLYSAFGGEIRNSNFEIRNKFSNPKSQVLSPMFPILALTVSGGHTMLVLMKGHGDYEIIGQTIDDAVGEAYDKVARLLGLGYPGGPAISKLASKFRETRDKKQETRGKTLDSRLSTLGIVFPRPIMNDGTFNFSFSGLKTAVLVKVKKIMAERNLTSAEKIDLVTKEEIAAAFEEAVADVLTFKTIKAVEKYSPHAVIFTGGVSANLYLKKRLETRVEGLGRDIKFLTPPKEMSGDNAAMIGLAAYYHIQRGDVSDWKSIRVDANLKLV